MGLNAVIYVHINEKLLPNPMSDISHFKHGLLRKCQVWCTISATSIMNETNVWCTILITGMVYNFSQR